MTCIVGIANGAKVYMGADSMVSDCWMKSTMAEGKLWKSGGMLFGSCGLIRTLQVLRHHLTVPMRADTQDIDEYLVATLMPAVMATLAEQGLFTKSGHVRGGNSFMLGYSGNLYSIDPSLAVQICADGYGAEGSGAQVALGALHATPALSPKQRLTRALEAAAYHELHVAPPFVIQSV
mgnify:CR=1 FL=1